MNKAMLLFAVIIGVVVAVNVVPLRRGDSLSCVTSSGKKYITRMAVRGLPFGFLASPATDDVCTLSNQTNAPYPSRVSGAVFTTASLWFDLIIYGAVLAGAYVLIEDKRA